MSSRRYLAALLLAVASAPALAGGCTARDRWTGPDKTEHAAAGLVIGMGAAFQTRDPWAGFRLALAVGAAKELLDLTGQGTCSLQDLAVTAAAGLLGAQLGGLAVVHLQGKTLITYRTTF